MAPEKAENQDAVGVPAALRWQTAAGGIGSRKGKGPTKWEGPPAAVCHLSATKQRNKAAATKQQQSSRNKAAATKQPQQKHKRLAQTGQPLFHLRQPESPISPP